MLVVRQLLMAIHRILSSSSVGTINFADHRAVSSIADHTVCVFNLGADTRIDIAAGKFFVLVGVDVRNVTASDL